MRVRHRARKTLIANVVSLFFTMEEVSCKLCFNILLDVASNAFWYGFGFDSVDLIGLSSANYVVGAIEQGIVVESFSKVLGNWQSAFHFNIE